MRISCPWMDKGGFSFIEAVTAVGIVATFFVTLFAVSSQCMYFVNSSRELITAGQTVQSRLEQFRDCTGTQISDANYIKNNILNTTPSGSSNLGTVTEVVTVNAYPTALSPGMQLTRASNGTVTIDSTNAAIANSEMTTVGVQLSWTASPGARARSLVSTTVWAAKSR